MHNNKGKGNLDKKRLDQLLVDRSFFSSKSRAQAEIMLGNVLVNNIKITKSGKQFPVDSEIRIIEKTIPYVSRGALKLKGALQDFNFPVCNLICCDLGASTGGFTEILLLNGAKRVYSVDVGYGQLHWKIRDDKRVLVMERTNARFLTKNNFKDEIDFVSGDLSFISLKHIIPSVKEFLKKDGFGIFLIKPQFELDAAKNVKGIVKEVQYRKEAIETVIGYFLENEFSVLQLSFSHIKGPKGNVEFTILVRNDGKCKYELIDGRITDVINSHI